MNNMLIVTNVIKCVLLILRLILAGAIFWIYARSEHLMRWHGDSDDTVFKRDQLFMRFLNRRSLFALYWFEIVNDFILGRSNTANRYSSHQLQVLAKSKGFY